MTLQERILAHLQKNGGELRDAMNVAELIAVALDTREDRVRDAIGALEARGLATFTQYRATLTEQGLKYPSEPEPAGRPRAKAPGRSDPPAFTPPAPAQTDVASTGAGRVAERESVGAVAPAVQSPSPTPDGAASKRPAAATAATKTGGSVNDRQAAILDYLRQRGGVVRNEDGMCSSEIQHAAGLDGTLRTDLRRLDETGLIEREIRGKRTFSIELTPRGIAAAREAKGGRNGGHVQELRGRGRVGANAKRRDAAVRRKAVEGNGAQPRATARRPRARKPVGARRAVRTSDRRVHAASRDVQGRGAVETETEVLAAVTRLFVNLTPPQRHRTLTFLLETFGEAQ